MKNARNNEASGNGAAVLRAACTDDQLNTERTNIMKIATITATIWSDTYSLRANWADAASAIERETEDGWLPIGMQVADYSHSTEAAMRAELELVVVADGGILGGDESEAINAAIEGMV